MPRPAAAVAAVRGALGWEPRLGVEALAEPRPAGVRRGRRRRWRRWRSPGSSASTSPRAASSGASCPSISGGAERLQPRLRDARRLVEKAAVRIDAGDGPELEGLGRGRRAASSTASARRPRAGAAPARGTGGIAATAGRASTSSPSSSSPMTPAEALEAALRGPRRGRRPTRSSPTCPEDARGPSLGRVARAHRGDRCRSGGSTAWEASARCSSPPTASCPLSDIRELGWRSNHLPEGLEVVLRRRSPERLVPIVEYLLDDVGGPGLADRPAARPGGHRAATGPALVHDRDARRRPGTGASPSWSRPTPASSTSRSGGCSRSRAAARTASPTTRSSSATSGAPSSGSSPPAIRACDDDCSTRAWPPCARDFSTYRAGWFSRFHESLAPTDDERAERADAYLGLLRSRVGPTVSFAVGGARRGSPAPGSCRRTRLLDRIEPVLVEGSAGHREGRPRPRRAGGDGPAGTRLARPRSRPAPSATPRPTSSGRRSAWSAASWRAGRRPWPGPWPAASPRSRPRSGRPRPRSWPATRRRPAGRCARSACEPTGRPSYPGRGAYRASRREPRLRRPSIPPGRSSRSRRSTRSSTWPSRSSRPASRPTTSSASSTALDGSARERSGGVAAGSRPRSRSGPGRSSPGGRARRSTASTPGPTWRASSSPGRPGRSSARVPAMGSADPGAGAFLSARAREVAEARREAGRRSDRSPRPPHRGGWIDPVVLVERLIAGRPRRGSTSWPRSSGWPRTDGPTRSRRPAGWPARPGAVTRYALGGDEPIGPTAAWWVAAARVRAPGRGRRSAWRRAIPGSVRTPGGPPASSLVDRAVRPSSAAALTAVASPARPPDRRRSTCPPS